jgi:ABC-type transport system substrate-binding protein
LNSLLDSPGYQAAHYQAQTLFAEDLPAIPLYIQSRWIAMRPDLCGLEDTGLSGNYLWNLEGIDYGEGCSR